MNDWPPPLRDIAETFNARAATYDLGAMHRWLAARAVDQTRLTAGMTVLDLAAGTGLAIREAAGRLDGKGEFIAVDIAAGLLRVAAQAAQGRFRLKTIQSDAAAVPLPDACADVILCVSAMAYLREPTEALREWRRLVRRDGQLVFQTFAAGTMTAPRLLREAAASQGIRLTDPNAALGTVARCSEALHGSGFALVEAVEDRWREPLPDPDAFWLATVEGVHASPVAKLSASALEEMKRSFTNRLRAYRAEQGEEDYRVFFVRARPVG